MQDPFKNRLLGFIFVIMMAVCYFIIVPPVTVYCWIKRRPQDSAKSGSWFFRRQMALFRATPIVEGLENIPKNSGFVVMANHQSFIDIGTLMYKIVPLAFLAKKELFRTPLFGRSLKFMGCIPIDRGNMRANSELPNILRNRISKGFNYCVFPEGTRSSDGTLLPFKNGMFKIISQAPVNVLPVTLIGTGLVMPKNGFAYYSKRARMVIHPLISPEQIAQWTPEEFRETVRNQIASAL